jgi:hypothetical protein
VLCLAWELLFRGAIARGDNHVTLSPSIKPAGGAAIGSGRACVPGWMTVVSG